MAARCPCKRTVLRLEAVTDLQKFYKVISRQHTAHGAHRYDGKDEVPAREGVHTWLHDPIATQ